MSNNGWFSFLYANQTGLSEDKEGDNVKHDNDDDVVVTYDHFNFKEVTALMLDAVFGEEFYEDTMQVLNSIPDLNSSQIGILNNIDRKGLLIDGKKRGWHKEWIEFESYSNDAQMHEDESFYYTGWFYVQYDEQSKVQEPFLHYPEETSDVIKYYPSRHTWKCFETKVETHYDDENEMTDSVEYFVAVEQLYCVTVTHTALPTDYVQFAVDEKNNVVALFERYNNEPRLEVEFSEQGVVRKVSTFTQDVKGTDADIYRVFVHAAPVIDDFIDF